MNIYSHGTSVKDNLKHENHSDRGVGHSSQKIDAKAKLLGRLRYTDDIKLPNMLFGKIVRSPHAHALIKKIDKDEVLAIPGVHDVIVGEDLAVKYGVIPWTKDEYPLAYKKARYVGDAVAAVIADSEALAYEASLKLKITYEVLPAVLNCEQAKISETKVNEQAKVGNITKKVELSFGEVDKNFGESALVLTKDFSFQNTTHAPIEPHCAIADYGYENVLTVYSSTQVPHYLHRSLAEVLSLPEHGIRVIQPPLGGAFGGKSEPFDLEFVVSLASMRLKRPVKILYTREEVFLAHRGRHPMNMTMSMGLNHQGEILAVKNDIDIDGGAYASFGMITAFYAGQLLTGPIDMKSYQFKATRFYTNKPACGPKRGHGSVQPRFAFEVMLDIASEKLGIDPIKLRLINAVKENSETINGQQIGSMGLSEVLEKVAKASKWEENFRRLPFGRGLGIASSMYISGTNYPVYPNEMPQSSVLLRLDRSGMVHIFSGASDIGQGANTVLMQIVQQELGLSRDKIRVTCADSDLCPVDLGAYSSRVTLMMGHAAMEACQKAKRAISEALSQAVLKKNNCADEEWLFQNDEVRLKQDLALKKPFTEAIKLAEAQIGSLQFGGDYRTKARGGDYRGGSIGASPAYSCTAHVADVSVNIKTGQIKINKIYVAHDCGKAINPVLVEGQMEGSTYMGASEVFLENFLTDEEEGARKGLLINPNLLDYRIPTTLDAPEIESFIVECPDKNGPYGAKEAGEGPLHSAIPAVANAIYDAVGIRLFHLPFSPSKVLQALKMKEPQV